MIWYGKRSLTGTTEKSALRHVLAHPWVVGELALGQLSDRSEIIWLLQNLPTAEVATDAEVLNLVENRHLFDLRIRYVDGAPSGRDPKTVGAGLWTREKRLSSVAARLWLAKNEARRISSEPAGATRSRPVSRRPPPDARR